MSQKEKNNEVTPVSAATAATAATQALSDTFVNACWQPYETLKSQVLKELQKQDDMLRQSWNTTRQQMSEQQDKAQQLYQDMIDKNVFLTQSDALKNVALQAQALMKTPFDFTLDLIEKANTLRNERVQAMVNLQDQYVSAIKQNQLVYFRSVENNIPKGV